MRPSTLSPTTPRNTTPPTAPLHTVTPQPAPSLLKLDTLKTFVETFPNPEQPTYQETVAATIKACLACVACLEEAGLNTAGAGTPLHETCHGLLKTLAPQAPEQRAHMVTLLTATLFVACQGKAAFNEQGDFLQTDYVDFLAQQSGLASARIKPQLDMAALVSIRNEATGSPVLALHIGSDIQVDVPDHSGMPIAGHPSHGARPACGIPPRSNAGQPPWFLMGHGLPLQQRVQAILHYPEELARAVSIGDCEAVMEALQQQPVLIDYRDHTGDTVLHLAAWYGQAGLAQRLLEAHPPLLLQYSEVGDTALHRACQKGDLRIVQMLCKDHPALPHHANQLGCTPRQLATLYDHPDIVQWLQETYPGMQEQQITCQIPPLVHAMRESTAPKRDAEVQPDGDARAKKPRTDATDTAHATVPAPQTVPQATSSLDVLLAAQLQLEAGKAKKESTIPAVISSAETSEESEDDTSDALAITPVSAQTLKLRRLNIELEEIARNLAMAERNTDHAQVRKLRQELVRIHFDTQKLLASMHSISSDDE